MSILKKKSTKKFANSTGLSHTELKNLSHWVSISIKKLPSVIMTVIPDASQQREFYETLEMLTETYESTTSRKAKYAIVVVTIAVIAGISVIFYFKRF
jgi:hypothetical protein